MLQCFILKGKIIHNRNIESEECHGRKGKMTNIKYIYICLLKNDLKYEVFNKYFNTFRHADTFFFFIIYISLQ